MSILQGPAIQGVAAIKNITAVPSNAAVGDYDHDVRGYDAMVLRVELVPDECEIRVTGRAFDAGGNSDNFWSVCDPVELATGNAHHVITRRTRRRHFMIDVSGLDKIRFSVSGAQGSDRHEASLIPGAKAATARRTVHYRQISLDGGGNGPLQNVEAYNTGLFRASWAETPGSLRLFHRLIVGGDTIIAPVYTPEGQFIHQYETPPGSNNRMFLTDLRFAQQMRLDQRQPSSGTTGAVNIELWLSSDMPPNLSPDPGRFQILTGGNQLDGMFSGFTAVAGVTMNNSTRFCPRVLGESSGDRNAGFSNGDAIPDGLYVDGPFDRIAINTGAALVWLA